MIKNLSHPGSILCFGELLLRICPDANGLLWIPGSMTQTEIYIAQDNSAELVKVFPGNVVGPDFVTAVKELFPRLLFMPTGGVEMNVANIGAWFSASVCAVGMGSALVSKEILEKQLYQELYINSLKVLEMVKKFKL